MFATTRAISGPDRSPAMTLLFAQTAWLVPLYPLVASLLSLLWSPGLISRTGPRPCGWP